VGALCGIYEGRILRVKEVEEGAASRTSILKKPLLNPYLHLYSNPMMERFYEESMKVQFARYEILRYKSKEND